MANILKSSINVDDWETEKGMTERAVKLNVKVQFRTDEELMKVFNLYEQLKSDLNSIKAY